MSVGDSSKKNQDLDEKVLNFFVLPLENSVEWLSLKKTIELKTRSPLLSTLVDDHVRIISQLTVFLDNIRIDYPLKAIKSQTLVEYLNRFGIKIDERLLFELCLNHASKSLEWAFHPRGNWRFWLSPYYMGVANLKKVEGTNVNPNNITDMFKMLGFKIKKEFSKDFFEIYCADNHLISAIHPDFKQNHCVICLKCNPSNGKICKIWNFLNIFE